MLLEFFNHSKGLKTFFLPKFYQCTERVPVCQPYTSCLLNLCLKQIDIWLRERCDTTTEG